MIPEVKVTYTLQSSLDRAIDQNQKNLKKSSNLKTTDLKKWNDFQTAERAKVQIVAQIQQAHAMISGGDTRAWRMKTILAEFEIGIDDPYNGC